MAEEDPGGEAAAHRHEEKPGAAKTTHADDEEEKKKKQQQLQGSPARYPVRDGRRRALCIFIIIFLVLAGITALTVWLVYRPHNPKFRVVSAAVYELNATSPPFISASMQFTMVIRNPNKRVSIFYDHLTAFVSYKNQAMTAPVMLPPLFQESKSTVALSPLLGGAALPVEAEVANSLGMDEAYGVVGLRLVLTGKLRYKAAGAITSGRYGMYVRCDLLVALKKGFVGQLPLLGSPPCTVDV